MLDTVREQGRQWLMNLAASLHGWQLVIVSGDDVFAGAMVWSFPGPMRRLASVAELRAWLNPAAAEAPPSPSPEAAPLDPTAPSPLPQQVLPVGSEASQPLNLQNDRLFFLLCDDLSDGEVEEALALLDRRVPLERRRLLCVLVDWSDRQRLLTHLAAGAQGLCTIGSEGQGRIYTALAVIASGGLYLDPLFLRRLHQGGPGERGETRARRIGPQELLQRERQLLREVCRGYSSPEIATRLGLACSSVRRYLSQTYQRIGVRDRTQAVGWCVANGLIRPEELQRVYLVTADGSGTEKPELEPSDRWSRRP